MIDISLNDRAISKGGGVNVSAAPSDFSNLDNYKSPNLGKKSLS